MIHHYPFLRRQLAALALAVAIAAPVAAKDARPQATASVHPPVVRIDNFGRVNERYYRGAMPGDEDFADLVKLGVKTTIDLTDQDGESDEQQLAERAGMKFFKIAMNTRIAPTTDQIATFMSIVNDPENQPVYVHCVGGRHRTGVMTAIYRMLEDKWTPAKAFQEMKSFKFGADFLHPEFKRFVYSYQAHHPVQVAAVATKARG